ncbi:MAG: cysteine hydrolase [Candidatus Thermoplasmatota archaeon]|nr:cysteine hydrolase [Candidatus Thermoplasmatota archaeon]
MKMQMTKETALILIDVQKAWDDPVWGKRNNPMAETVMSSILGDFRKSRFHVYHVVHDSRNESSLLRMGKPGFEIKDEVKPVPGEPIIVKHVNSAFIGTDLQERLHRDSITGVVFCGITTDHCVSTSARMSANLGFITGIVSDACVAYDRKDQNGSTVPAEEVHRVNLASLDGEFASVFRYGELMFS